MTYNEFKNKYLGKKLDFDGVYGAQCYDLAQQYITECLELPASILAGCGVVNNMLKEPKLSLMKQYFDIIPLNQKKQGDIEIFDWGHIAIMDHWNGSQFVNYYLTQNSGTAENPIGGVYVGAIADNPNCMAFRKKVTDEVVILKKQLEDMTNKYNEANEKLNNVKKIVN